MKKFTFFLISLLVLTCTKRLSERSSRPIKYQLTRAKAQSFEKKLNKDLFESFVLGDKAGLPYDLREKFKTLGVIHLMTPSGLHYGVILFAILFIFKNLKFNHKTLLLFQIYLGVICYSFLDGLFAFRRYALLFSTRIFNKLYLDKYFSSLQILLLVFLFDFYFGTKRFSPMSYALSFFFIGIFIFSSKSKLSLYYNLFVGQCIIAYTFENSVSFLNIILSPLYTVIFTLFYPLLSFNTLFLKYFNYSEFLIEGLLAIFETFYHVSTFTSHIQLTIIHLMLIILLNRKNFLLIISLLPIYWL